MKSRSWSNWCRKRKKKTNFSPDEKKKLARLVEERPAIWNLEDNQHSNLQAVSSSWRYISIDMEKTVEDCKQTWKALKDGLRYHCKASTSKIRKSGSAANLDQPEESEKSSIELIDWEFVDCLKFLKPLSTKRRTFSSASINLPDISKASTSSYDFNNNSKVRKDSLATLTECVTGWIQTRKEESSAAKPELKNFAMFLNLDQLLQRLPKNKVVELNIKFQQMALDEVIKFENSLT